LLGEHRELHAIWTILTQGKRGYALHPETLRWKGRLKALYLRHERLVAEMHARGYRHQSPLDVRFATGKARQDRYVDSIRRQMHLLTAKDCRCRVGPRSRSSLPSIHVG
jgi:hypothetical protein